MHEDSPTQTASNNGSVLCQPASHFEDLLEKVIRLKDFAITNNYEVDPTILKVINDLIHKASTNHAGSSISNEHDRQPMFPDAKNLLELDEIRAQLTAITFPVTIDNLSPTLESESYSRFKLVLIIASAVALSGAVTGFVLSVKSVGSLQLDNSVLALFLGLLGAIVYSLFGVLRVIPAQAFDSEDAYTNYARLFLGLLLGWVFYFAFSRGAFALLAPPSTGKVLNHANMLLLILPFFAGYSTKFVVGVFERTMVALETALAIGDGRDKINRRTRSRRSTTG